MKNYSILSTLILISLSILLFSFSDYDAVEENLTINGWQEYSNIADAGFDSAKIKIAEEEYKKLKGASVLAVYKGNILINWGENARRFTCASVRKSFLSALLGNAIERKELALETTLHDLKIDDRVPLTEAEKQATISDMLTSRSGVYIPASFEAKVWKDKRPERGSHQPGSFWYYNNWDFNTLGTIYETVSGKNFFSAFKEEIAEPSMMEDFRLIDGKYFYEPEGSKYPAYLLKMSARDMARFGLLYLNNGKMNNKQIIAEGWTKLSTEKKVSFNNKDGYSFLWWTTNINDYEVYYANGTGVQGIYLVPGLDLVFVFRVNSYDNSRVNDGKELNLLKLIIDSKVLPEQTNPDLQETAWDKEENVVKELSLSDKFYKSYTHSQLGLFNLVNRNSFVVLETGVANFYIYQKDDSTLMVEDVNAKIEFKKDPLKNNVVQFEQKNNEMNVVFYY
jgi:CubicO group peptidase (beta-lactamase class C family)